MVLLSCLGLYAGASGVAVAQDAPAQPEGTPEAQPAADPAAAPADPAAADPTAAPAEAPALAEASAAEAPAGVMSGWQFEGGLFGGVHFFGKDLELGVDDAPGLVSSPQTTSPIFGLRLGVNYLPWIGVEGELGVAPGKDRVDDFSYTALAYRGNVLLHLLHGRIRPFLLVGGGAFHIASTDGSFPRGLYKKELDGEVHGGVGVKWDVTDAIALRFDGRGYVLPNNKNNEYTPDWELTLGLSFKVGGAPPPPPAPPPAPTDADGDGIVEPQDKCPAEPEDADGFEDEDGCPEPDNDKDGIADADDKCPIEAETANGIDDEDGCPEVDSDNDGLLGSADKCPNEAEDKDGFEDEDGCPDNDNDKDGVPDAADKCKDQPETKNGFQDADGCPDEVPAEVKKFTGVIKGITFKKNSADIQKSSFKLLGDAVKVLKDYPDTRIEISGHTSSEGNREKNIELSKARAESVKSYLVSAGVDSSRITTVGHGPDKPIALNKTRKGREQNRRIEFRLLTDETPAPGSATPAPGSATPTP